MKQIKASFNDAGFIIAYSKDPNEQRVFVNRLSGSSAKAFGLDIETGKASDHPEAGLDPHLSFIRLIQVFDNEANVSYVFDLLDTEIIPELKSFLESSRFIAHSAGFELKHFLHKDIELGSIDCSMLLSQFVGIAEVSPFEPDEIDAEDEDREPTRYRLKGGYSLENLIGVYFGVSVSKEEQKSDWNQEELSSKQILYAGLDAVLTYKLAKEVSKKVKSYRMVKAYSVYRDMLKVIADMEYRGSYVSKTLHNRLIREWEEKKYIAEKECEKHFSGRNLRSPKQLSEWVEEEASESKRKYWPRSEKSGMYTFNRVKVAHLMPYAPLDALFNYKKYATLLSTFGESLQRKINPVTKRLHCSYTIGQTRTGRLSCRQPNLQNMPARDGSFRHIFKAPKGRVLVVADFSQIEIRVAGELSGDPVIRKAFRDGVDLHKLIVSEVSDKPIEEVTKEERQLGKAINFGLQFGMGAKKLSQYATVNYGVHLSEEDAQKAWNAYHTKYKVYSQWANLQREKAKATGYTRTPLGKMRKLEESEVYTKAVNTPVQGGAAEVLFLTMVGLRRRLRGIDAFIINTVHDEIIIECAKGLEEKVKTLLTQSMQAGLRALFKGASLNGLAEAAIGKDWAEAK